jgi:hypothetical protein
VRTVVLAISKKVDAVMTGDWSPTAMTYLTDEGIEVITGVKGTVFEAVGQYRNQILPATFHPMVKSESPGAILTPALKSSGKQLAHPLPIFVAVVMRVGPFTACISKEFLSSIFGGNALRDTLIGTGSGSILSVPLQPFFTRRHSPSSFFLR